MPSLPQFVDEDVREIEAALKEFLDKSGATAAVVAAEGGFLIFQQGDPGELDFTTLSALAANSFSATQAIAGLLSESGFTAVYQQGVRSSILISQISRLHLLIVVFPANVSVGAVKYFAAFAIRAIAAQLQKARERAPGKGLDLALLNVADSSSFFRMKPAP